MLEPAITLKELAKEIGVHYFTAWRMWNDLAARFGLKERRYSSRCIRIPRSQADRFHRIVSGRRMYRDEQRERELDARHAVSASGVRAKTPPKRTREARTGQKGRRCKSS